MKSLMSSMGSPKNLSAPCVLHLQQAALDGAHAGGADVAVLRGEALGVVPHVLQHGAQVLQVQQQHARVVGDLEHQVQHAGLGLVQVQHARQQQRAHVGDGGAHRVALFAEHVPHSWTGHASWVGHGRGRVRPASRPSSAFTVPAWLMPVRSPFTSAMNTGTPILAEVFGQGLQRDRLAGAGGAGDQAVAVGLVRAAARRRWWRSVATRIGSAMAGGSVRCKK
jgi:hypothetical protein